MLGNLWILITGIAFIILTLASIHRVSPTPQVKKMKYGVTIGVGVITLITIIAATGGEDPTVARAICWLITVSLTIISVIFLVAKGIDGLFNVLTNKTASGTK